VEFFLAVSMLSLSVAFLFTREGFGAHKGIAATRQLAAGIKDGAVAVLKRQYKIAVALLGLLLPAVAYGQPEQTGGGEANLTLPDLSIDREFSRAERPCPSDYRIALLRRRPAVWLGHLCAVEEPAGSSLHARHLRADL
jgi:hypothetical protein